MGLKFYTDWILLKKYLELKGLDNRHYLLKYFTLDEHGFDISHDLQRMCEFYGNFAKDVPSINEIRERSAGFPREKYEEILNSHAYKGYLKKLGREIEKISSEREDNRGNLQGMLEFMGFSVN